MQVGELCTRAVVTCHPATSTVKAAQKMRDAHIGNIVIVEERGDVKIPVGLLTDRDIVVQVVAGGVDPGALRAGDLMSREVHTMRESESIHDAIERMRRKGVHRLPVVDASGALVGIVALDDLLAHVSATLVAIADVPSRSRGVEAKRCVGFVR